MVATEEAGEGHGERAEAIPVKDKSRTTAQTRVVILFIFTLLRCVLLPVLAWDLR